MEDQLSSATDHEFRHLRIADFGHQIQHGVWLGGWLSPKDWKSLHFQHVCQVAAVVLGASLKKAPVAFLQYAPIPGHGLSIGTLSPRLRMLGVDCFLDPKFLISNAFVDAPDLGTCVYTSDRGS